VHPRSQSAALSNQSLCSQSVVESTDLLRWLRASSAYCVVLLGHSTSGVVLSTYTALSDLDFRVVVVKDACADSNETRHEMLCDLVFPMQGQVAMSAEIEMAMKRRPVR